MKKGIIKVPTEIYTRVVGYFQPVHQWNKGKKQEFKERKVHSPDDIENALKK